MRRFLTRGAELAPNLATATWAYRLMRQQRRRYAAAGRDDRAVSDLFSQTPDGRFLELAGHELFDFRFGPAPVVASQKYDELIPFLERVRALGARRLCEIGTSAGGTLYALTRVAAPDATIVSADLAISLPTRHARARFARGNQRVVSIEGNSTDPSTRAAVEAALEGEPLDVLFIDGDHSYTGVRADFESYSELVRPAGLIGLHDINEDFSLRHGVETPSISGDVPRFWRELKERYETEELIADPEQDGYGIGIVLRK